MQRANEQVDINIIVATGIYTYHEAPIQFHFTGSGRLFDVPEPMVKLFNLDYLREIADAGSLLGMDRFGIDVFLPFEDRVTTVAALAKAGYADRMVLSHDASCYSDFYSESYKTALLPRWNYTHITDDVLPALREHGVDEAQITAMLVHNPARYFTGGQE